MFDTVTQIAEATNWATMPCTLDGGPAPRAAIGLIVLMNDTAIEPEMRAFLPSDGVSLYSSRIYMARNVSVQALKDMEQKIPEVMERILPDDHLDVVGFGCTSGSMAIGPDNVAEAVHKTRPGVAVTDPVSASMKGLRAVGAKRIALLTPYPDEVNKTVEDFVGGQGFDIAVKGSFKQPGDPEITRVPPDAIFEAGVKLASGDVDALFVSCTALRCSSAIQRIEDAIGKPVVTANQALAWDCLRLAGYSDPVKGYGRLFSL
jgi:maleate isomerase